VVRALSRRAAAIRSGAVAVVLLAVSATAASSASVAAKKTPLPAPAKAAPIAVGSGVGSQAGAKLGGLYVYIPNVESVKIGDRSPVGGNGATLGHLSAQQKAKYSPGGKLAGGRAIPGAAALQLLGGSPAGMYLAEQPTATTNKSLLIISTPSRADSSILLTSSGYGLYDVETTAGGRTSNTIGFVFGGNPTAKADMPKNVVAKYNGAFIGLGTATDGSTGANKAGYVRAYQGDVSLTLDTARGTVKGNVYNIEGNNPVTDSTGTESFGLAIDAKVNAAAGNTYQGAVNFTKAATTSGAAAVAGATQSNVIGGFYGPKAAETAGALQIQGKAPGAGLPNDLFVTGAYGAKKQ
jgi:hypothetical protein